MEKIPDEVMFIRALAEGPSAAILAQEAHGQQALVNSAVLPSRCIGCTREEIAAIGIVFGEDEDDIFVRVVLPSGWKKVPTPHAMWSHLQDDQGRARASIFYKAAFYDRDAHISLCRRINVTRRYGDAGATAALVVRGEETLFETPIPAGMTGREYYDVSDAAEHAALAWADEHYPDWRNVTAYWD